jgi:hypothetical protein
VKEAALALIKIAAALYQPLAALLSTVLAAAPDEDRALADEVRAMLPPTSASAEAARKLGGPPP